MATLVLKQLFPENQNLGSTIPAGSAVQTLTIEFILTFFLMIVIMNVALGSKEVGVLAGISIGATILLEATFAGPITGASMNPARSVAPGILSGNTNEIWLYIVAPLLGSSFAASVWRGMRGLDDISKSES